MCPKVERNNNGFTFFRKVVYIPLYTQLIKSIFAICKMNADCFCIGMVVVLYILCTKFSSLCKFLRQFAAKKFTPEEELGRSKKEKMMKNKKILVPRSLHQRNLVAKSLYQRRNWGEGKRRKL